MKRIVIGLIVFAAAFLVGYYSILPLVMGIERSEREIAEVPSQPAEAVVSLETPESPQFCSLDGRAEYDPETNAKKNTKVKLLWTGDFHSEDFPYKSGEKWLGLFKDVNGYALRSTKIEVKKIRNPELFDITVETQRKGNSLFMVRGKSDLREDSIPTVYDSEDGENGDSELRLETRTFVFNGIRYDLSVENIGKNEYLGNGSKLVLMAEGNRQILRYLKNGCNDCTWNLIWAGDLDLDGKLDLYMDLTDHYNVTDRMLFLSSPADTDKIVRFVASFRSVGC